MKKIQYFKEKFSIILSLLFSHSYIVITEEDMMAHACTEQDAAELRNQVILAGHKFDRMGEDRAASVVRG